MHLVEGAPRRGASYVLSGIGLSLLGLWLWYAVAFDYATVTTPSLSHEAVVWLKAIEVLVVVAMAGSLLYAGYWLERGQYAPAQRWSAVLWTVLGGIGITAVVLVMNAHQMAEGSAIPPRLLVEELLLGAAGGSVAGLLIGMSTAQSMRQGDRIQRQRDAFSFLNKLLRHNILNGVTVIRGNASLVAEDAPEPLHPPLRTIEDRCDVIGDLVRDVRHLARLIAGDASLQSVDLSEHLRSAVDTARNEFPNATVRAEVPDDVAVRGNGAIDAVFDNLLTNAIEHNDADDPRIHIIVDETPGRVCVRVADNGPGIPPDRRGALFEPSDQGDHGMGLYLVDTIITHYGGEVRVTDNDPRGTVFTVDLPKTTPEDA